MQPTYKLSNKNDFDITKGVPRSVRYVWIECPGCGDERRLVKHHITEDGMCKTCRRKAGYKPTDYVARNAKLRQTCLARYGVDNPSKLEAVKEAKVTTCLTNFGVEHPMQALEVRGKVKATCFDRYGVEHPSKSVEYQAKQAAAFEKTIGVKHPLCLPSVRKKMADSIIAKHGGVLHGSEVTSAKIKATTAEKYGVENPMESPTLQAKAAQTKFERYGSMSGNTTYGKAEAEVRDFINALGYNLVQNRTFLAGKKAGGRTLGALELDGLDAVRNVAVEYCGVFWHSVKFKDDPRYHWNKYEACTTAGVRLFTIFEDEWVLRGEQVRGFLRAALGGNTTKVYARHTVVEEVSNKQANAFYEQYHIQGAAGSTLTDSAGLFVNDELVACMSFGRHPRGGDTVVLTRLCFKQDVSVVGGASKLFNFLVALTGAKTVLSWSDNRWSQGQVYKALGFTLANVLPPDYSYVSATGHTVERKSKQSQSKKATRCPAGMTEEAWAEQRGLVKIWDCGKTAWSWTKAES